MSWGRRFKSQHRILDGYFSHIFVEIFFVWKDENTQKVAGDGPFLKKCFNLFCHHAVIVFVLQWPFLLLPFGSFEKAFSAAAKLSPPLFPILAGPLRAAKGHWLHASLKKWTLSVLTQSFTEAQARAALTQVWTFTKMGKDWLQDCGEK